MSIFHLSVKPISRSAGRSAVAAAAYRSGTLLEEVRSGETHDYTRKRDIVHGEIATPAGSPGWALDRSSLWNAAEVAEKRINSRVARDYELAIPRELTREQGIELVRDFSEALVERYGVAVDFNVHKDDPRKWDGSEKGWQGYHAHVMATTRRLGRDGFGEKASIELSDAKRKAIGLGSGAEEIQELRELWETLGNRHLERAGSAERLDRRSLAEQGIDRPPTVHLGPYVTELERRGVESDLGNLNRDILAGRRPDLVRAEETPRVMKDSREVSLAGDRLDGFTAREESQPASVEESLRKLAEKRATWLARVIERAQRREVRRERALEARVGQPWDIARAHAVRLLEQARALTQRLREALEPRRLAAWARERVRSWSGSGGGIDRSRRIEPTLQAVAPEDYLARRRAEFRANRDAGRPRSAAEDQGQAEAAQAARSLRDEAAEIRRGWAKEAEERRQAQEAERHKAEAAARQKALDDAVRQRALEDERRRWGVSPRGADGPAKSRGDDGGGGSGRGGPER